MSDLKKIQEDSKLMLGQIAEAKKNVLQADAGTDATSKKFEHEIRTANKQDAEGLKLRFNRELDEAKLATAKARTSQLDLQGRYDTLVADFLDRLDPVQATSELDDTNPILLFPLRLETRFKVVGNNHELWLRVYPDDCNVAHNETLLSESEVQNARAFWSEMWKAGGEEIASRGAWKSLVNSHGAGRASYIIKKYKPADATPIKTDPTTYHLVINSNENVDIGVWNAATVFWTAYWLAKGNEALVNAANDLLINTVGLDKAKRIVEELVPYNITDEVPEGMIEAQIKVLQLKLDDYTAKKASWTQAPAAEALPDKFVCILSRGNTKRRVNFAKRVANHLPVGYDPSLPESEQIKKDANGNLIVNEELKWMVDFDKAVEKGMATKIPLSSTEHRQGFDSLKVLGIRFTADAVEGKKQLEDLLEDHFHSKDGLSLMRQGTPTNNTEEEGAGYSWEEDANESYDRLFMDSENYTEMADLTAKTDGNRLAESLGINADLIKQVSNASGKDMAEANAMNKALFPATLGYFMEEMMDPLFSDEDINQTKDFFANYVSGRGYIPSVRIGKQPYGILPVTVYSKLRFTRDTIGASNAMLSSDPYLQKLYNVLTEMEKEWTLLAEKVPHVGQVDGDPHQTLLDVLGLHATSVDFHQRYALTLKQIANQASLFRGTKSGISYARNQQAKAKSILASLGIDAELKLPILEKFFTGKPNFLNGPFVDDVPETEDKAIRDYTVDEKNYIEWLSSSDANTVRLENFGGNPAPKAILYLLLRHSLMQAQADAATRFLLKANKIDSKKTFYDPDQLFVSANDTGKSKFEHLYTSYPDITGGNDLLAKHIYKPAILLSSPEARRLRETLDALKLLENVPTARLSRLLAEHIDCCSYRLDAWMTALTNYKLQEQRKRQLQLSDDGSRVGTYLGAYGWLLNVKSENKNLQPKQLNGELETIFTPPNGSTLVTDNTNLGFIHAPSINQAATAAILRNAYDSNKDAGSGNPFAINLTSDRVRTATNLLEGMRNGQELSALLGYQFERGLHDKHSLGQGEIDKFIYPLRKVFPLVANRLEDTKDADASIEAIEARNVLDGLKLLQHVQSTGNATYPFGLPASHNLPAANGAESAAINAELKKMAEANDAVGDLIASEQVYQSVKGNVDRAAGNVDAFSKGNYPPDTEVNNTPRTGTTITQRLVLQLDTDATALATDHPRTKAEPAVATWLKSVLPNPANVLCHVTYNTPSGGEQSTTISQQDLGLEAADIFAFLNTDKEQAMNELDDRITNHIRYTIANHAAVSVHIEYTKIIDPIDRGKVSFFELSALMSKLQKILRGNRYLQPEHLSLPAAETIVLANFDNVLLRTRINDCKTDFESAKNDLQTWRNSLKDIAEVSATFVASVSPHITDEVVLASLPIQMEEDIKSVVKDPSAEKRTAITAALETILSVIGNAATEAALSAAYNTAIDNYITNLATIDADIEETVRQFAIISLYKDHQTGTGFMLQGVQNIYSNIFAKNKTTVDRWQKKADDYDTLLGELVPALSDEERFIILNKMERLVSVGIEAEQPADLVIYRNEVELKRQNFDTLHLALQSHATTSRDKLIDFITDVEVALADYDQFDAMHYDLEAKRNDLAAVKLSLVLLREDVTRAIDNVLASCAQATAACTTAFADADVEVVINQKIPILLNAAKTLLGDNAVLIPQFNLDEATGNEMEKAFDAGASEAILDFAKTKLKEPLPVETWLAGVARVKTPVHNWEQISVLTEALSNNIFTPLTPLQFPYKDDDRWLATTFKDVSDPTDEYKIETDKLLYTAQFAKPFNKAKPQCGIIIDDWVEVIPGTEETTGISFHYDQPNSEPPQTMLLVTPPVLTGKWNWQLLEDSLDETLELAKKRAVEPAMVATSKYAQFLPATIMAASHNWLTMTTNLAMNKSIYTFIKKD